VSLEEAPLPAPEPAAKPEPVVTPRERAALVQRLFAEHNEALIGFLLTRVNSEQEARDVAQEAYVRMLELDAVGAVSFLRAYLFKIAANLATDRARQRATHLRLQEQYLAPLSRQAQPPTPERTVAARQELELVRRFMAELPPRCREAFYWHRFRDLSVLEIAQQLGVSDRMVRAYLVRALAHCSERLAVARGAKEGNS
jgi:RNA polymerase sigma-70 factor (ECF subfamily)